MPTEITEEAKEPMLRKRYRGRIDQIRIYLGKLLRMFLYQSDWKVLPMAALVAGLTGIAIRWRIFRNMEGTLISSLAIACVCLWNGCFNSIQVICRERDIIKREHRAGMHISSYIAAHMIYQALLCLIQTGITIYVLKLIGVSFPDHALFGKHFLVEFFISLFLITYAADMMSLWISALSRTTTAAMTVMPVVLIFQLVFSGGMMNLPESLEPVTDYIISGVGFRLIAAEADYNNLNPVSSWYALSQMKNTEISGSVTVGQAADLLRDTENPTVQKIRDLELLSGTWFPGGLTVGGIVDHLGADDPFADVLRKKEFHYAFTVGDLLRLAGEDRIRGYVTEYSRKSLQKPEYDYTLDHIAGYWLSLLLFAGVFALFAVLTLEFIDKDRR